jgi:hypothetical protein
MMRRGRFWRAGLAGLVGAMMFLAGAPAAHGVGAACVGDCGASGTVGVDDLVKMINIAVGILPLDDCQAGDSDGSGTITVDEITQAVDNALRGCGPSPTPTATPTQGPLGPKHFVLDPANSHFKAALSPQFILPVPFRGQTNGVVENAYIDFEAGAPDVNGLATINITGASEYIFADLSAGAGTPLVLCLKPMLPVMSAGTLDCNGGPLDFSIVTSIHHNIGQIGVDGYTAAQCSAANGTIESPNQICAAGTVGVSCAADADCNSTAEATDGRCGLSDASCTSGKTGAACRNDSDCDTTPDAVDGTCGQVLPHPGVCNGPIEFGQSGQPNRPGEITIAPAQQFGLNGFPMELILENALPCGDEGPGLPQAFAMTTGLSRTTVFNFNNGADDFPFSQTGTNFDCKDWASSPGKFVLSFAVLHQFGGNDVITGFEFGSTVQTPTPTTTPTPTL